MDEESQELLDQHQKVSEYLERFIFIARHRILFEVWPQDLKAIAGIDQELLGPATQNALKTISEKNEPNLHG